ncbi:GspL/Epsl periplasmic domain-containing protein [Bordetella avium]|uniref:General secretion pathway protein L n=3 Tax=Bordetella avium TaxID=521 RepID=Q2KZM9_BORA1|nr:GspL/Epsl periplasmic domain-containing protein [Bordetella avium]RIQ18740.1 general secretion pathway protein GspL [Bordetella avium]RIQ53632.1 general secretion pathway protein GspL [Bordetella avium]RIQ72065.1 general secretion pathway protein GspL [Bordetella avium]RIQ74512.1 general secretion pathway protein GspL [Bordetella avium]CAJ47942.1 Putative general secretion pathway protein L [Bordetella avium 197N]
MKNMLRVALPPLAALRADTLLPYAWHDRRGGLRQGESTAQALATAFRRAPAELVMHPDDIITTVIGVPPLGRARQAAVVRGALEPLVLGDLNEVAIGYADTSADGQVEVAWTPRPALEQACALLAGQGMRLRAIIPPSALGEGQALQARGDPRWRAPSPGWSLELPRQAGNTVSQWRSPLQWAAAAALLWLIGLNLYASHLEAEARALRARMTQRVQQSFNLPVVLDPLRQAQQGLAALGSGQANSHDFLSLARDVARLPLPTDDRVKQLNYADQALTLQLFAEEDAARQVAVTPKLIQQAASLGLKLEQQEKTPTWRITRNSP